MHSLHHLPFIVEHVTNPRHGAVLDAAKESQILKVQTRLGIDKTAGNQTQVNSMELTIMTKLHSDGGHSYKIHPM